MDIFIYTREQMYMERGRKDRSGAVSQQYANTLAIGTRALNVVVVSSCSDIVKLVIPKQYCNYFQCPHQKREIKYSQLTSRESEFGRKMWRTDSRKRIRVLLEMCFYMVKSNVLIRCLSRKILSWFQNQLAHVHPLVGNRLPLIPRLIRSPICCVFGMKLCDVISFLCVSNCI